jgi:hypothetical protein
MDHSYAGEFAEYVHTLWAERRFCRQQCGIECRHYRGLASRQMWSFDPYHDLTPIMILGG